MNGKAYLDRTLFDPRLKKHLVGDTLKIRVRRGEAPIDLKVGLAALHWRFEEERSSQIKLVA